MSETVPPEAIQSLKDMAQPQGGWEWSPGWGIDTNTTAVAIQALAAAGEPITSSAIVSGLNYLKSVQNADGGFPYSTAYGSQSDTNSTAYVIQALQAVVQPPPLGTGSFGSFVVTNSTPISYLLSMQLSDGSFEWQTGMGSDQFATRQAIPALLGKPFPLNIREISEGANVYLPLVLRH
jgi:prenyltransferase beta subunit